MKNSVTVLYQTLCMVYMFPTQPGSLTEMHTALVEKSLRDRSPGTTFQAERIGYFSIDPDSSPDKVNLTNYRPGHCIDA